MLGDVSIRSRSLSRRADGRQLPAFETKDLAPGTRLGVAVSGGGDSVALLRLALALAPERGWAVRVLHLEHGLRGAAAREDAEFVEGLARELGVDCSVRSVDTAAAGREYGLGLEEAGRLGRYGWFRQLLGVGGTAELDAIVTGHTLDDQAETVLAKLLRGGWTAGLAGIYPRVAAVDLPGFAGVANGSAAGCVVRPLLGARREELRNWLRAIEQAWREDGSNKDLTFTRNRIRMHALPVLREVNAQAEEHLAQLSVLARDEEAYWRAEVERVLSGGVFAEGLLQGRPVRGGGRASSTVPGEQSLGFEVERLRAMPVALRRRVLRATAERLGAGLSFEETERMSALVEGSAGSSTRREQLTSALRVERTARELRFVSISEQAQPADTAWVTKFPCTVPGEVEGLGVRLRARWRGGSAPLPGAMLSGGNKAILRVAKPGDRVRLRYSGGAPKRVKEVLERMGVSAAERAGWPLVEWRGEIVWLQGAVLEATPLSELLELQVDEKL